MRFVGSLEVARYIETHPSDAAVLQSWVAEMRHRAWPDHVALGADFRSADVSKPPRVIFKFASANVQIETVIDFRRRVVLLTKIKLKQIGAAYVMATAGNA